MTGEESDQPRTYPAGVTCWIDTEQPDVDAAIAFYGGLLGWSFADAMPPDAPGRYVIATLNGRDVAAIGSGSGDSSPAWNTYIAVDDTDASTAALANLGAEVVAQPADAGPGGRNATLRDPQGAELRLWQARRRLGAQLTNIPGTWNFSDLRTTDPANASAFYDAAFGWRFVDMGYATAIQVTGYGEHLKSTVDPNIRKRQEGFPEGFADVIGSLLPTAADEPPHWHVTFSVADRDESAALAEQLGAEVLDTAETDWTRTATLRDPQGAVFTASQFTPPNG